MSQRLILASGSATREQLLRNAGVICDVMPARVDEMAVKESMIADAATARDIADALAELKAIKQSRKHPAALVLGCDQVLSFEGELLSKPESPEMAVDQLRRLQGKRHDLLSAAVICEGDQPVWRHVGTARLVMREMTDGYLDRYVARNWDRIRNSVGAYRLEEEGVRLFAQIQGDYFSVLGLPLLEVLAYLEQREVLDT